MLNEGVYPAQRQPILMPWNTTFLSIILKNIILPYQIILLYFAWDLELIIKIIKYPFDRTIFLLTRYKT